jgi:hypothetical protein
VCPPQATAASGGLNDLPDIRKCADFMPLQKNTGDGLF